MTLRRGSNALALLILGFGVGCQGRDGPGSSAEDAALRASPPSASPAASAVGMCAEHGVLEAVCTRCNPKLIPIFQTKGDWCAEHEFPESFCPICHPELGGRPQIDVAADEAPADGVRIRFATKDVAEQIGLETATALAGEEASTVIATATIVADAAKFAVVAVRSPGVIRSFRVDLGARVGKGAPLAVIESASVAQDRSRLQAAKARAVAAEANYAREEQLGAKGISSVKVVQAARQELAEAQAEVAAAASAVEMIGGADGGAGVYTLLAPIAGVVTVRHLTVGTLVDPEHPIFEILDTSTLWGEIDIPESQASRVAAGQHVRLEVDALPGQSFEGIIDFVAPVIDARTRTIKARSALANPNGVLRANMYARAHISVGSAERSALVPRSAVQEAKGVHLVFVPISVDEYETRRVQVAPSDGDLVALLDGVLPGEEVVTTGSFLLKTETLKGSIGAGCCEVETGK